MAKTLLVMAGGTGGHVFPGLAVADALKAEGWYVHWLGTPKRMEAELVPANGYPISFVDVEGVRGNGLVRLLAAPFKLLRAVWQARKAIKQLNVDVVLGMGGFAAGPGGIAARLCGVPLVIHEQNAAAGLTNRYLAPLASTVLCGFDGAFGTNQKAQWVGNPLRAQIQPKENTHVPHQPLRILVVGGSLGALALNDALPRVLRQFGQQVEVLHQCGKGRSDVVRLAYQHAESVTVQDFIADMASAYQWADVVICRAGALTVSEIAQTGVAAIFVPLPQAVDDHQAKNALSLVNAGAALMVRQGDSFEQNLIAALQQVVAEPHTLANMAEAAKQQAKPSATLDVANICKELAGESV